MNQFRQKYGNWGVVAGGAIGLGAAFSRALAKRTINVVIIDKEKDHLKDLQAELRDQYQIEVAILQLDLSENAAAEEIYQVMDEKGCRLLVYNAAYGPVKKFISNTSDELDYYIDLNSRTPLKLSHLIANHQDHKEKFGLLIMSSLAGIWGTQLVAPYSATKAFDLGLGEALYHELKPLGIDVTVCCAGATDTPNYRSTGPQYGLIRPNILAPEKVAEKALDYLGMGPVVIPGFFNKLTYFMLNHLMPRKFALYLMNGTMRNMYPDR
jgi:short-subunit dehydrogenase